MSEFTEWLDVELDNRGWTRAELSRRAGVSQATLSLIYSGQRGPSDDTCQGIARALKLPIEEVYRYAELLPPVPEQTELMRKAVYYLSQLDPGTQMLVVLYLETLVRHYKQTD